jgi:hypothetical protein
MVHVRSYRRRNGVGVRAHTRSGRSGYGGYGSKNRTVPTRDPQQSEEIEEEVLDESPAAERLAREAIPEVVSPNEEIERENREPLNRVEFERRRKAQSTPRTDTPRPSPVVSTRVPENMFESRLIEPISGETSTLVDERKALKSELAGIESEESVFQEEMNATMGMRGPGVETKRDEIRQRVAPLLAKKHDLEQKLKINEDKLKTHPKNPVSHYEVRSYESGRSKLWKGIEINNDVETLVFENVKTKKDAVAGIKFEINNRKGLEDRDISIGTSISEERLIKTKKDSHEAQNYAKLHPNTPDLMGAERHFQSQHLAPIIDGISGYDILQSVTAQRRYKQIQSRSERSDSQSPVNVVLGDAPKERKVSPSYSPAPRSFEILPTNDIGYQDELKEERKRDKERESPQSKKEEKEYIIDINEIRLNQERPSTLTEMQAIKQLSVFQERQDNAEKYRIKLERTHTKTPHMENRKERRFFEMRDQLQSRIDKDPETKKARVASKKKAVEQYNKIAKADNQTDTQKVESSFEKLKQKDFDFPYVWVSDIRKETGLPKERVDTAIKQLRDSGKLNPIGEYNPNHVGNYTEDQKQEIYRGAFTDENGFISNSVRATRKGGRM